MTGKFVDTFLCVFFVTSMLAQAIILKELLIFTNFFMGATFGMIAQRMRGCGEKTPSDKETAE